MTPEDLLGGVAFHLRDREQHVFGGDVFVLEVVGFLEGTLQQLVQCRRHGRLCGGAGNFGQALDFFVGVTQDGLRTYADLFQNRRHNPFPVFDESCQRVQRQQLGVAVFRGDVVGALHRFLRLYGEFVPADRHGFS